MDVLAMYQPRANAPLDEVAKLCGFPGKLGMDGSQVWHAFQSGKLAEICDYCETDVVNTLLLYLRFEHMRGALTAEAYHGETARVRAALQSMGGSHWQAFLSAWKE
jgi:predicted PolB exonuclease-like 3'-5' exonuclease